MNAQIEELAARIQSAEARRRQAQASQRLAARAPVPGLTLASLVAQLRAVEAESAAHAPAGAGGAAACTFRVCVL